MRNALANHSAEILGARVWQVNEAKEFACVAQGHLSKISISLKTPVEDYDRYPVSNSCEQLSARSLSTA
jgi:hypothetical protein